MAHFDVRNAIPGITVEFVSTENGAGWGQLRAATADTLAFTAPGGTEGAEVEIANGETQIVYDETTTKFIVVQRTSATDLSGTALILITLAATAADRLAEIDTAITNVLNAQREGLGDATVLRADLAQLTKYRREVAREVAYANGTASATARPDLSGNF